MKALVFSPPFKGHLNVLTKLMLMHPEFEYRLVNTGWSNLPIEGAISIGKSVLRETDPALWTFPRMTELMDESLRITEQFQPDLIVYDFFSLEGLLAAKNTGIPAWCSIPAMIGPNTNSAYLESKLNTDGNIAALQELRARYGLDVSTVEMMSDGLHIPGDINLVWSYPELVPQNFMQGRANATYVFVGNYNARIQAQKNIIYFSLGTVVMDNLWKQQEQIRSGLKEFVRKVTEGLSDEHVVFVTQGKHVLDTYPATWRVQDHVDQVETLSRSKAFITHGGCNSYHEAVLQGVPMVVIPFFGDQILVGQQTESLGIGINLGGDTSIDTRKSKAFLNGDLAQRAVAAVKKVLHDPSYRSRIDELHLTHSDLGNIFEQYFPGYRN